MNTFLTMVNPGFLLLLVGIIGLFLPIQRVRQGLMIATPLLGLLMLASAPQDMDLMTAQALGVELILYRVDTLNYLFGLAFLIAALLNAIYAVHTDDRLHDGMAMALAGSAVTATFAGDLMTLFIFWELTAIGSVFLILRAGTRAAYFASMRYIAIQILSGVLLLDGVAYVYKYKGSLSLDAFADLDGYGAIFFFLAIGIKAAFPLLHNWLQDAYSKSTVVGGVVLSTFVTTLAVLACARLFPGLDHLVWIGAVMVVFPVFFAVMENDLRKVLAYALNIQVGFMICAIGLADPGTAMGRLAMNGAAAHAFTSVIFMALLFMAIGAVLHRAGTAKASELGGLYNSMPFTTVFCLVGAASISALPLFSGFVSRSLTFEAVAGTGNLTVWLMLLFGAVGVFACAGIKVPFSAFFGAHRGRRVEEAPFNMLLAMGIAAAVCILVGLPTFMGLGHGWLYDLLPYPTGSNGYQPFAAGHVLTQVQLLMLAALAFILLKRLGLYPAERSGTILDTDWTYRRLGFGFAVWANAVWAKAGPAMSNVAGTLAGRAFEKIERAFSPRGQLSRGPLSGGMAIWTAALLGMAMLLSFITVR